MCEIEFCNDVEKDRKEEFINSLITLSKKKKENLMPDEALDDLPNEVKEYIKNGVGFITGDINYSDDIDMLVRNGEGLGILRQIPIAGRSNGADYLSLLVHEVKRGFISRVVFGGSIHDYFPKEMIERTNAYKHFNNTK
jgi:hypothetical protein